MGLIQIHLHKARITMFIPMYYWVQKVIVQDLAQIISGGTFDLVQAATKIFFFPCQSSCANRNLVQEPTQ